MLKSLMVLQIIISSDWFLNFLIRIAVVLPVVLEQWDVPMIPGLEEEFPDSIKLSQAVATWKCIVRYQQTLQTSY